MIQFIKAATTNITGQIDPNANQINTSDVATSKIDSLDIYFQEAQKALGDLIANQGTTEQNNVLQSLVSLLNLIQSLVSQNQLDKAIYATYQLDNTLQKNKNTMDISSVELIKSKLLPIQERLVNIWFQSTSSQNNKAINQLAEQITALAYQVEQINNQINNLNADKKNDNTQNIIDGLNQRIEEINKKNKQMQQEAMARMEDMASQQLNISNQVNLLSTTPQTTVQVAQPINSTTPDLSIFLEKEVAECKMKLHALFQPFLFDQIIRNDSPNALRGHNCGDITINYNLRTTNVANRQSALDISTIMFNKQITNHAKYVYPIIQNNHLGGKVVPLIKIKADSSVEWQNPDMRGSIPGTGTLQGQNNTIKELLEAFGVVSVFFESDPNTLLMISNITMSQNLYSIATVANVYNLKNQSVHAINSILFPTGSLVSFLNEKLKNDHILQHLYMFNATSKMLWEYEPKNYDLVTKTRNVMQPIENNKYAINSSIPSQKLANSYNIIFDNQDMLTGATITNNNTSIILEYRMGRIQSIECSGTKIQIV